MLTADEAELRLPVFGFSLWYVDGTDVPDAEKFKWRQYYLLAWVGRGGLQAMRDDERWDMASGQAIVLPPGSCSGFSAGRSCAWYQMKFGGTEVAGILDNLGVTVGKPFRAGPPPAEALERLRRALADVTPVGALQASSAAYDILAHLPMQWMRGGKSHLVERALAMMHAGWSDGSLNVSTLADRLGVHRTLLPQRFRSEVGVSPSRYLRRIRVRQALALLEGSLVPMAEVARRCGYADSSQFSRLIRRETGRSPREIRTGS
jgi:AraC-like DNA-binding protein